jgi:Holliday junction resolvase
MRESRLQSKIINDLKLYGWEVLKMMKGNEAGWPDIFAFKNKVTVFIEAKKPGEEAKELQKYIHRRLEAQGFQVFVIDTWEQYMQIKYLHLK